MYNLRLESEHFAFIVFSLTDFHDISCEMCSLWYVSSAKDESMSGSKLYFSLKTVPVPHYSLNICLLN